MALPWGYLMRSFRGWLGLKLLASVVVAVGLGVAAPVVMGASLQPAGLGKALLEGSDFKAGADRAKKRLERRESQAAKAERRDSRKRYRRVSRGEALAIVKRSFPQELEGRLFDGQRPAAGLEVSEHLDDNAAVVKDAAGNKHLMRSTLALRARDRSGRLAPVDLSLRDSAAAFATENSNADLQIAKDAGEGTRFESGGFSIAPEADAQATQGIESADRVFYDDVAGADSDTAFIVAPQPEGAELSWLLLSAEAPERLVLKVDLPQGAKLRRTQTDDPIPNDPPSTLEITRSGETLGWVQPPLAYDADGVSVESQMQIEGKDHIVIKVKHRDGDLNYPLYVDPEVSIPGSKNSGWAGWRNSQYPTPANQGVNYYGFALNNGAYNPNGVYMSMPTRTWFSPTGTAAGWTYTAPEDTYIYRTVFGGMSHTPLRNGYAFSLWYQGLANSTTTWEPNVSYLNQSGGYGANPFGPAAHAAYGVTHDFCFNRRCNRSAGSEQNAAHFALAASNPLNGNPFYTYDYRASLTMDWANVFLGDRQNPTFSSAQPPSTGWEDDNSAEHNPGLIRVTDRGLGLTGVTLAGAASGNGTIRERACIGDPRRDPCPKTLDTAGFRYRLNEGQTVLTLTAKDIVDNPVTQTWTKKIDRSKPALGALGGTLWDARDRDDDHRYEGIYGDTASLTVNASDSQSGIKEIEVYIDDESQRTKGGYSASGQLDWDWNLSADPLADGTHKVEIMARDNLYVQGSPSEGRHEVTSEAFYVTIDRRGDIHRANKYLSFAPDSRSTQEVQFARPGTHDGRLEEGDWTTTRTTVQDGGSMRDEVRRRSNISEPGEDDQEEAYSTELGASTDDPSLETPADILTPAQFPSTDRIGSGPILEALEPWQTAPPAHGSTYTLYAQTGETDDGELVTLHTFVDTRTQLPLKQVGLSSSGSELQPRLYYSYSASRLEESEVPHDFFQIGAPPTVGLQEDVDRKGPGQPVGQVLDLETGDPIRAFGVGGLLGLVTDLPNFLLGETEVVRQRVSALTAAAPDEPDLSVEDAPDALIDQPQTTVNASYNIANALGDEISLSVISMAANSSYARGWRSTYQEQANADPAGATSGLLPVLVGGLTPAIAYLVDGGPGRMSAFMDINGTSVMVEGAFAKTDLLTLALKMEHLP